LTDEYLSDQGILPHELTGLDRLAYVGDRGLGALTFEPDQGSDPARPSSLDLAELVAAARDVVTGDLNDTPGRRLAVRHLQGIGTSAGGAQAKALVGWNRATGAIRAGQGVTDGFEPWLLKFDLGTAPGLPAGPTGAGRIEYAYHLMAVQAGIEAPEARLVEESGRAHFLGDLRTLADRCDVPDWTTALEAVQAAVEAWSASAAEAGVDAPTTKAIGDRLATIRRAWSAR
jgi:serine/threonine-protein kinase HipA